MTGRHLYDKYTDAVAATTYVVRSDREAHPAWPLLPANQRRIWNDAARRLTPKRPKAATKA